MNRIGLHTQAEILSQPEAWAATLEQLEAQAEGLRALARASRPDGVLFTGCGSTYYLALAAATAFQGLTGLPARGLPASEIWLATAQARAPFRRPLLVAVSRSGETTETLRACGAFRATGGAVLTLSCYPGRPLTELGALNLVFPGGQERSVAQTRAFSTLYLATLALACIWSGRHDLQGELSRLPELGRRLLATYRELARQIGRDQRIERTYLLGSGLRYGLACELSLKLKEMSLSHSEPFHTLEFRHGPQSMAGPGALIVGLISATLAGRERAVLEEMRRFGADVLAVGERDCDVNLGSGLSELAASPLYLPVGQLVALERALARGLDPDQPHQLSSVVRLEEAV